MPDGSASARLLRPKLLTTLEEGYTLDYFRRDLAAGATVAVVALPLSMAIAVASGVGPERGLFTAIIGGFIVSALSGSRFQIGGPAGAFIVLVAGAVAQFGVEGLLGAVMLSGVMLVLLGMFRIGSLVRHIPHAVTVGFTAGIAVTIAASQLKDLGGLTFSSGEPAAFFPKLIAIGTSLSSLNSAAFAVGVLTVAVIFLLRALRPTWPAMLIAVAAAALIAFAAHLPIETIGSRFGAIPRMLPAPALPGLTFQSIVALMPTALSFTLLGAIESLLSAKVADGMTGRKHRSNMELIGQGFANIGSAIFGGLCVTGTIARTATNIRAGGRTPVAGMLHALLLLAFMFVAAPIAGYIPLAALAGVLLAVCWTMAEKAEFSKLLQSWPTALVLLATFVTTLAKDLSWGIALGCAVAAALAWMRQRVPEEGA